MCNPHDPDRPPPEWFRPPEYIDLADDEPEDSPDPTSFQTRPSAIHPRSGKLRSNCFEFINLAGQTVRFDFDRLSREDVWYGRDIRDDADQHLLEEREGEILCRLRPAGGGATRWLLLYVAPEKGDEAILTLVELESHPWYRNSPEEPPNRELSPDEASEWLDRERYALPEDLDPAPPFDRATPARGRLDRDRRPGPPEVQPVEGELARVVLRGPRSHPLIDGKPKAILTKAQYDVVATLRDARPAALKGAELIERSKHSDARGILARLREDPDWDRVIEVARTGYRLL